MKCWSGPTPGELLSEDREDTPMTYARAHVFQWRHRWHSVTAGHHPTVPVHIRVGLPGPTYDVEMRVDHQRGVFFCSLHRYINLAISL